MLFVPMRLADKRIKQTNRLRETGMGFTRTQVPTSLEAGT